MVYAVMGGWEMVRSEAMMMTSWRRVFWGLISVAMVVGVACSPPDLVRPGDDAGGDQGLSDVGDEFDGDGEGALEDSGPEVIEDVEEDVGGDAGVEPDAELDGQPEPDADIGSDPAEPPGSFIIYLAPDGRDDRSGATLDEAILTLSRAQEILKDEDPETDIEVRIGPGRYQAQRVVWTYTRPEQEILFTRLDDEAPRPVFDGCDVANPTNVEAQCTGDTWFRLNHSGGEPTNLNFHYIRVERYRTAISLNGDRNSSDRSNGYNRIYGCYFDQIGNGFAPHLAPSTAAIRLVNSVHNEIANNHFVDVINRTSLNMLHAIYVAHLSSHNLIRGNRFYNNTGDPVRVRDFSNYNQILKNRFIKVGQYAGYTDWYCDHDSRDDCTKPEPECPSWQNEFRDNELDGTWGCDVLGTFEYFQGDSPSGCSVPEVGAVRLRTSGNIRPEGGPCAGY